MMKKLFLLSVVGALGALNASAQMAEKSIIFAHPGGSQNANPNSALTHSPVEGFEGMTQKVPNTKIFAKTTASGSRWYSYVEYLSKIESTITTDSVQFPYMWGTGDAQAIYSTGSGGFVAETISFTTMGITLDPAFSKTSGFNESTAFDNSLIAIERTTPYKVDSVNVFSTYGRNNFKTSSVDTLRVTLVYGNGSSAGDLPLAKYTGASMKADYGVDSILVPVLKYDSLTHTGKGTTKITKDIYLTSADTSSFVKAWGVNFGGVTVPAGNIVGVSATFLSGETYTKLVDTAFYGSLRPANPFGMGMMRPRIFADATNTFNKSYPAVTPGYYNFGYVKFKPQAFDAAYYSDKYVPNITYVAAFDMELPDIDVKLSCTGCKTIAELLSVKENTVLSDVKAFPNPANTQLNIPVSVSETANVTVSISNMLGQVVATQNLGSMNAGQKETAVFNTTSLSAGVYLYTVDANGQRVSNRFSVSH